MKNLIGIIALVYIAFIGDAFGTCLTPISRVANGANQVLTSTKYNLDHDTAYAKINSLESSCLVDGTLTIAKLDASSFAAVINGGIMQGCGLVYSSASAISINPCFLSVNGNLVRKTSATALAMGCGSCSGETADTAYYVYALTTSTGSTLNLIMSTTAPGGDGLDGSGNKVLGKFYNNNSSDIDRLSFKNWNGSTFILTEEAKTRLTYSPTYTGFGTVASQGCAYRRDESDMLFNCSFTSGTPTTTEGKATLPSGYLVNDPVNYGSLRYVAGTMYRQASSTSAVSNILARASSTYLGFSLPYISGANDPTAETNADNLPGSAVYIYTARVPIRGWQ